jgi:hypothetical protein
MNCLRLRCVCECGGYGHPHALWVTEQKQLRVAAICIDCGKNLNVFFPLTDLFKACPPPDFERLDEAIGQEIERIAEVVDPIQFDEEFARAIGIKVPSIRFTAP